MRLKAGSTHDADYLSNSIGSPKRRGMPRYYYMGEDSIYSSVNSKGKSNDGRNKSI